MVLVLVGMDSSLNATTRTRSQQVFPCVLLYRAARLERASCPQLRRSDEPVMMMMVRKMPAASASSSPHARIVGAALRPLALLMMLLLLICCRAAEVLQPIRFMAAPHRGRLTRLCILLVVARTSAVDKRHAGAPLTQARRADARGVAATAAPHAAHGAALR